MKYNMHDYMNIDSNMPIIFMLYGNVLVVIFMLHAYAIQYLYHTNIYMYIAGMQCAYYMHVILLSQKPK